MAISFAAGQLITASQMNLLAPILVSKSTTQSVTNSATLVNDNDIVFTFVANQTVHVQAHLVAQASSAAPGLRLAWAVTGTVGAVVSAAGRMVMGSPDSGTPAPDAMSVQMRAFALATNNANLMNTANSNYYLQENLLISTGASGGTLQLQFAQFTATAAQSTSLMAGTFAIARYVA